MSEEENTALIQENYDRRGSYEQLSGADDGECTRAHSGLQKWRKLIGIACGVGSALIYATVSFNIKFWRLNPTDIIILRGFVQASAAGLFIAVKTKTFWPTPSEEEGFSSRRWFLSLSLLLYSLCSAWTNFASLRSIALLPLGDAITLIFMAPVFTAIIARVFRKMPIKAFKIIFIIVIILGVNLIMQPPFIFGESTDAKGIVVHDIWYFIGAILALSAALSNAARNNILAVPLKDVSASIMLYYVGINIFISGIVSSQFDAHSRIFSSHIGEISAGEWLGYMGVILGGMTALYITIKAFQLADTVVVVIIKSLEIPISYGAQIFAMDQVPNALGGCGACLVVVSVIIIPCEKFFLALIPESFVLKKYI